jgi:hypothetical protein
MHLYSFSQLIILSFSLATLSLALQCETERDLNFEECNLIDLTDEVLTGICNRIGLDMIEHVLPTIVDEAEDTPNKEDGSGGDVKKYTHEQYARGAEECLLVEAEMDRLAKEDPEALDQMEREALEDDPALLAEIISDVLSQDKQLLKDVATKIKKADDKAEIVKDITEEMLNEGEQLEDRPDILGYLVATIIIDDPEFLDEFDEQLAEGGWYDEEDWEEYEEDNYGDNLGGGDEL